VAVVHGFSDLTEKVFDLSFWKDFGGLAFEVGEEGGCSNEV